MTSDRQLANNNTFGTIELSKIEHHRTLVSLSVNLRNLTHSKRQTARALKVRLDVSNDHTRLLATRFTFKREQNITVSYARRTRLVRCFNIQSGVRSRRAREYLTEPLGWYNRPFSPCKQTRCNNKNNNTRLIGYIRHLRRLLRLLVRVSPGVGFVRAEIDGGDEKHIQRQQRPRDGHLREAS
eukprot:1194261-Prorocentrum_minimum.AAC.4